MRLPGLGPPSEAGCPVCGSDDCKGFPDSEAAATSPFLRGNMAQEPPAERCAEEGTSTEGDDDKRAKRGPAEDRMKRLVEDREAGE